MSFNFQSEYFGNLSGADENASILNLRSVIPLSPDWIARIKAPVVTLPLPGGTTPSSFDLETGLGDINAFAIRLLDVGPADVLLNFSNPRFQWGDLAV